MSILTTFFSLIKPSKGDRYKVSDFDANFDIIDEEMHKPPLTVNGIAPDSTNRNISIVEVPLAGNLSSDSAQLNISEFIQRASGGGMSIGDGDAYITSIRGNMVHTGYIAEELEMTVNPAERAEGVMPITATIDRDTFVSYVVASGTITLTYTTAWSSDPALYGITVTGTPIAGDEIVVVYVKEDRGTITTAQPVAFNSTGWNLFSLVAGYAKVIKYSTLYGFKIEGTYSIVEFSETPSGSRTTVTLENGFFDIPSDGYVHVTGADATTCIYATWSDWLNGYQGDFESYAVDTIDLAEIMLNFPGGLCAIGNVQDEINFNTQTAIQRIQRLAYTAENLAAVIASGAQYDADTNYIYAVLTNPVVNPISGNGQYSVDDHGIEYFTGTTIPVHVNILYGENLKDKLRTDVLTISEQSLTDAQKAQVRTNIGAASTADITALDSEISEKTSYYALGSDSGTDSISSTKANHTLYNSRKFSDYNYILMVVEDSYVRGTSILPRNIFTRTNYPVSISWVDSVNTQYWVEFTYVNDTTYSLQGSASANGKTARLYGVSLL